jgi:hypothetical protein
LFLSKASRIASNNLGFGKENRKKCFQRTINKKQQKQKHFLSYFQPAKGCELPKVCMSWVIPATIVLAAIVAYKFLWAKK